MPGFSLRLEQYVKHDDTALIGKDNGRHLLQQIYSKTGKTLNQLVLENKHIQVEFPYQIVTINRSYFDAAFKDLIVLNGKEKFFKKFSFIATEHICKRIDDHVDRLIQNP